MRTKPLPRLILAAVLLLGSVGSSRADFMPTLSSPDNLNAISVGQTVTLNATLSGVQQLEVRLDGGAYAPVPFDAVGNFSLPTAFALDGGAASSPDEGSRFTRPTA